MRTPQLFAAAAVFCFFCFQSCKKNSDPAPNPVPTVKPDTLTAGWSKRIIIDTASYSSNYNDIFFNSATTGYLCSPTSLFKSSDGGVSWVRVNQISQNWFNCFVTADNKGVFINQSYILFRTLDGGSTFDNSFIGGYPKDVFFSDNNNGFCIAEDGLYNTVNGGINWQKITTSGLPVIGTQYASLSFINSNTGWVVSQNGIHKSAGSLTNWQPSVVNGGSWGKFGSVSAVSAAIVYAANFSGEIFKSIDGGANFSFIKKLEAGGFTDVHFLTDQIGYASSGRSIYKTIDAGINWTKVVSLGQGTISEIHFTDATHGWACGSDGIVLTFK